MTEQDFSPEFRQLCEESYVANEVMQSAIRIGFERLPELIEHLTRTVLKQHDLIENIRTNVLP